MVAALLTVVGFALLLLVLGILVGTSLQDLTARAPEYQESLRARIDALVAAAGGTPADLAGLRGKISPDAALGLATYLLNGLSDLFSNAFLILFLLIFMLLEVPSLAAKIKALGGSQGTWTSIAESVRGYLAIKTVTSFATGVLVGLFLYVLGIDFAVLWGLLAFLLNYVPNIGSIIAAVPAVLLALLQSGIGTALGVAAGYLVVNMVIGSGVEPRLMGEGLGLSTLVVFLSLILWGWLLGPVGMLLSVPLTTAVKLGLESYEGTRPLAVLLGSGKALLSDAA